MMPCLNLLGVSGIFMTKPRHNLEKTTGRRPEGGKAKETINTIISPV